jgi:hypothetical protein
MGRAETNGNTAKRNATAKGKNKKNNPKKKKVNRQKTFVCAAR